MDSEEAPLWYMFVGIIASVLSVGLVVLRNALGGS